MTNEEQIINAEIKIQKVIKKYKYIVLVNTTIFFISTYYLVKIIF